MSVNANVRSKEGGGRYSINRLLSSKFTKILVPVAVLLTSGVYVSKYLKIWLSNPENAANACRLVKNTLDPHLPCELTSASGEAAPLDREALWSTVRTACIPAGFLGMSYPCARVNYWDGFAVIRAPQARGIDFITTPLRKIEGVESPELLEVDAPNYWAAAWRQWDLVGKASKRKLYWDDYAMVVNSKETRSQDQLHIHLSCVSPQIKSYFTTHAPKGPSNWETTRLEQLNANFFLKFISPASLSQNIFKMIADEAPGARVYPERQTVALLPVSTRVWRGFSLMVSFDAVPAEAFLDTQCS